MATQPRETRILSSLPAVWILAALSGGAVAGQFTSFWPVTAGLMLILLAAKGYDHYTLRIGVWLRRGQTPHSRIQSGVNQNTMKTEPLVFPWSRVGALVLACCYVCSFMRVAFVIWPARQEAERCAGTRLHVTGTLHRVRQTAKGWQATVKRPGTGSIQLFSPMRLPEGSWLDATLTVETPRGRRNPGGFDYADSLRSRGIFLQASLSLEQAEQIQPARRFSLPAWNQRIREFFRAALVQISGPIQAPLLTGLLTGDTAGMEDRLSYVFMRAGLLHLTSVSGANLAWVLLPVRSFCRRRRVARAYRYLMLVLLLGCFLMVAADEQSIMRAVVMQLVFLMTGLLQRRASAATCLAATGCFLLLISPLLALSRGFWLSMLACGGLIYGADRLTQRFNFTRSGKIGRRMSAALAGTLCAQVAISPLALTGGGIISIPALLTNLPAGLLAGVTTAAAFFALPFGMAAESGLNLPVWIITGAGAPVRLSANLLFSLAEMGAQMNWGRLAQNVPLPMLLIVILGSVWFLFGSRRIFRRTHIRLIWLACLTLTLLWPLLPLVWRPPVQLYFLDVGQGDACLIQSCDRKTLLLDCGPPDAGYRVLLPALDALGIAQIDCVVLSHGHADHCGGAAALIEQNRVRTIICPQTDFKAIDRIMPEQTWEADLLGKTLKMARTQGILIRQIDDHDTISTGETMSLDLFRAPESLMAATANEETLFAVLRAAGHQVLFTADCSAETERRLCDEQRWPQASLLKVAHHGSRFTTQEAFLEMVCPIAAVISVGTNLYGHPAPAVLQRLEKQGCHLSRTDKHGCIRYDLHQDRISVIRMIEPEKGSA